VPREHHWCAGTVAAQVNGSPIPMQSAVLSPKHRSARCLVGPEIEPPHIRSRLNRPGAFRVNIQGGRQRAAQLLGTRPWNLEDVDLADVDRLLPHPVYASQGYVSVVNPGDATAGIVHQLLHEAHTRSRARLRTHKARTT
jgi:Family of unknown function (DUF6194)